MDLIMEIGSDNILEYTMYTHIVGEKFYQY